MLVNLPYVLQYLCLQRKPLQMVKQFLLAKVYAEAPNQTLREGDWNQRKAVILLKSVYLQADEGTSFTTMMEKVGKYDCYIHHWIS